MRITQIFTYRITDYVEAPRELKFLNRLGGWDVILLTKSRVRNIKIDPSTYDATDSFGIGFERVNYVESLSVNKYYTQWYPSSCFDWLKDLFLSPRILLDNQEVKLSNQDFEEDTDEDLIAFALTITPKYQENAIQL